MQALVARRRAFSSAHFYQQEKFSKEKNAAIFGRCFTPHGHGHNYVLEVFVSGEIDSQTRLVVNLADLDKILFEVTDPLDHHHLNFDRPEFQKTVPTTENIARYLREKILKALAVNHPMLKLNRLRLYETDTLWVELIEDGFDDDLVEGAQILTSEIVIRAIHRLSHPELGEQANRDLYGVCYGEHGHHYKVRVRLSGAVDPATGLLISRDHLQALLHENLVKPFDGADLNSIFPNTACEALTIEFYRILQPLFPGATLLRVGIQETKKNYFEFPVGAAAAGLAGAKS